jgi:DNA repair exonuclease SbcCD ATPase subunit
MSERAVTFHRVAVTRALGIGHGEGFELPDLSPGVNLIHGPNGSGKTTTALVLQALLWPGRTDLPRPTARGEYTEGDVRWLVDLDAGAVSATRDGQSGQVPDFGPAAERGRYRLALHELIVDDNRSFAETIVTVSQGGYDLTEASRNLQTHTGSAPRTLKQQLAEADEAVTQARRLQEQLHHRAQELESLRKEQAQARQAARDVERLEKARAHRQADEECERLQRQIDALPDPVRRLTGQEREDLTRIDRSADAQQETRREMERQIAQAEATLEEVELPEDGLSDSAKQHLRADLERLGQLQNDLDRAVEHAEQADTRARLARQRLGAALEDDQLAALNTVELDAANELAHRAHKLTAREEALRQQRALLNEPMPEQLAGIEPDRLHTAIHALSRWLQCPAATGDLPLPWPAWSAAALAVVLAGVLAAAVHWLWILTAVPAVALAGIAHWRRSAIGRQNDERETYRRDYERTPLPAPKAWRTDEIAERLEELHGLAARLATQSEREEHRRVLAAKEDDFQQQRDAYQQQREALREAMGIDWPTRDEWLPVLAGNLKAWQDASAEAEANSQTRDRLADERDGLLDEIGNIVAPLGCDRPTSPQQARAVVNDLLERDAQRRDARRQRDEARRRMDNEIDPALQQLADQRRELFERLGVDESAQSELDDWLARLGDYRELTGQLTGKQAVRDEAAAALVEHEELLELDEAALDERIANQRELADRAEELLKQITEIDSEIRHAKRSHELTDALSRRDEIAAQLSDAREAKLAEAAGDALIDWVRTEAVERARPEVFRRAKRILASITRGTLSLDIEDAADPPRFLARSGDGLPRPVEELSVGERVQLLMAVRLAFVEHEETAALPLILDEALGTTDDTRAEAMIDSLIELARGGRQVFYFTAQYDEVGKWRARLEKAEVAHREIDLAERRNLSAVARRSIDLAAHRPPEIPAPAGRSREAYGEALNVPGIDPRRSPKDVHLWHVVDDMETLHKLLESGVHTCGQLRTMLESGAPPNAGSADALEAAALRARTIERACVLWAQGRGRPVDRAALEDSDAVTDRFIDEVSALADELGGSASELLKALQAQRVSGFHKSQRDKLSEFFLETGYLDDAPVLTTDDLIARLAGEFAGDIQAGAIPGPWLRMTAESLFSARCDEA